MKSMGTKKQSIETNEEATDQWKDIWWKQNILN